MKNAGALWLLAALLIWSQSMLMKGKPTYGVDVAAVVTSSQ